MGCARTGECWNHRSRRGWIAVTSRCSDHHRAARARAPARHAPSQIPMTAPRLTLLATVVLLVSAACGPSAEHQRADSTVVAVSTQRQQLATQLAAQKDSLTRVVLQADDFISHIDSSVARVSGLPKDKKANQQLDPLAHQIENRQLLMARVDALVARTRATASALAKESKSKVEVRTHVASDSVLIVERSAEHT